MRKIGDGHATRSVEKKPGKQAVAQRGDPTTKKTRRPSAIVVAPTTQQAWRETSYERWDCKDTGRTVAVGWIISGVKWRVASENAPDRTKPACLKDLFLLRDGTFAKTGRKEVQSWAGDWNAHMWKDSEGVRRIGTHLLPSSTKEMGRKLLNCGVDRGGGTQHVLIVSFRPAPRRGTFMNLNGIQKDWKELDVAIVSGKAASMINSVRTINTSLGEGLWP